MEIESGSSRITVRKNEITLGYGHPLDPDNPLHWFIWQVFKDWSDWDRVGVSMDNIGSDVEICDNHIFEHWDGVENYHTSLRLNVHHNLIERLADDALEPFGDEMDAQWHDNTVRYANIAYRHKLPNGSRGPMYVYRNLFYSAAGIGISENLGIFWFSGNTAPLFFYHNTIVTSEGARFGSMDPQVGLPNVWLVNNSFSCGVRDWNDVSRWTVKPHVDYNYFGGDLSEGPPWWGKNNKVVQHGQLWSQASEPDYQLSRNSPAREVGLDISKPWDVDGKTHPALPGFAPGYFEGLRPDAGALQYHSQNQL